MTRGDDCVMTLTYLWLTDDDRGDDCVVYDIMCVDIICCWLMMTDCVDIVCGWLMMRGDDDCVDIFCGWLIDMGDVCLHYDWMMTGMMIVIDIFCGLMIMRWWLFDILWLTDNDDRGLIVLALFVADLMTWVMIVDWLVMMG